MMAFMPRRHELTDIVGHDQSGNKRAKKLEKNTKFKEAKKNE